MSRPLQPSVIKQLAQFTSRLDPRCDSEGHDRVALGEQCPHCKMDLFVYTTWIKDGLGDWPL